MANLGEKTTQTGYQLGYQAGQKVSEVRASIERGRQQIVNAPTLARDAARRGVVATQEKLSQAGTRIQQGATQARKDVGAETKRQQSASGIKGLNTRRLQLNGAQSTPKGWKEFEAAGNKMEVKGGPVIFWLVAGIAFIKDIIDVFSVLLDLLGIGLSATAIGAPVGIPLGIFSELLDKASGLFIDFTLLAYFSYIGGGFALRIVIMSMGAIVDAIPFVDILPLTTLTFFAAYIFGRGVQGVARSGVVGKAVKVAQFSQNVAGGVTRIAGRVARLVR